MIRARPRNRGSLMPHPSVPRALPFVARARSSARQAALRYVTDQTRGIRRIRTGAGFRYSRQNGAAVRDAATLKRIAALAIPPAWREVWICPHPRGHLQAVGRDARQRKQYRYHRRWREVRDKTKYNRMIAFGKALPKIRRCVHRDLRRRGLPRERVLATLVRLLDLTALRVGNEEYANHNKSYGLTTIHHCHAQVSGRTLRFHFNGKGGKRRNVSVQHPLLAGVVRRCLELPGQELFQYLNEAGEVHCITSGDVNGYLAAIAGEEFTAKDFRTWTGTVLAALALRECEPLGSGRRAKAHLVRAVEQVAERLGNTPPVCKKCYIHPVILEAFLDGTLGPALGKTAARVRPRSDRLHPEEAAVIALLQQRLKPAQ